MVMSIEDFILFVYIYGWGEEKRQFWCENWNYQRDFVTLTPTRKKRNQNCSWWKMAKVDVMMGKERWSRNSREYNSEPLNIKIQSISLCKQTFFLLFSLSHFLIFLLFSGSTSHRLESCLFHLFFRSMWKADFNGNCLHICYVFEGRQARMFEPRID